MRRYSTTPNHRPWLALAAAAMLCLPAAVAAQEQQPRVEPVDSPPRVQAGPLSAEAPEAPSAATVVPKPVRQASPMMVAIRALLDAEEQTLVELRARAQAAVTADEALAVQRDIERVKFETEISLLRVQSKFAREAGRTEVATRIDAAIAEMTNPTKPVAPAARPVPERETSSR